MNQQEPLPWPIPGMSERQSILFLAQDLGHQVNRWKHSADWWSGRILPHVVDKAKAAEAVEMVEFWAEKMS